MNSIFELEETKKVIERIHKLEPITRPIWGKMSADQMLAHCNVTYEMIYDKIYKTPKFFTRLMLKWFVKPMVVGEKPYKKNSKTAPQFLITSTKDFRVEKKRLIRYLERTQSLGASYFDNKESKSFGKLSAAEWNILFYKHLDHHLRQFGV